MSVIPENSDTPNPLNPIAPAVPASSTVTPAPSSIPVPVVVPPAAVTPSTLTPATPLAAPAAPDANAPYRPVPGHTPLKLSTPTPPAGGLRPAGLTPPASAPLTPAPSVKLPEPTRSFVSPMPVIEESDDSVPAFLPILAGIAAIATIVFAVLIFLKR